MDRDQLIERLLTLTKDEFEVVRLQLGVNDGLLHGSLVARQVQLFELVERQSDLQLLEARLTQLKQTVKTLDYPHLFRLADIIKQSGIDRNALLEGIEPGIIKSIPRAPDSKSQVLGDLLKINGLAPKNKQPPILQWFQNAQRLLSNSDHRVIVQDIANTLIGTSNELRSEPPHREENLQSLSTSARADSRSRTTIPITTVHAPRYELGFKMLGELLQGVLAQSKEILQAVWAEHQALSWFADGVGVAAAKKQGASLVSLVKVGEKPQSSTRNLSKPRKKYSKLNEHSIHAKALECLSDLEKIKPRSQTVKKRLKKTQEEIQSAREMVVRNLSSTAELKELQLKASAELAIHDKELNQSYLSAQTLSDVNRLSWDIGEVCFRDLCLPKSPKSFSHRTEHQLLRAADYQDRPELRELIEWWLQEGRFSVCALVGIGGAGKTALTCKFIEYLLGEHKVQRACISTVLPRPELTFVWSFYEKPSSDAFFSALENYLGIDSNSAKQYDGAHRVQSFIEANQDKYVLLVLDGLELVQLDQEELALGTLSDRPLRQLLRRMVGGLGNARALITSRYPVADLTDWQDAGFYEIKVDNLPEAAAIGLLRNRGVLGGDAVLARIIKEYGSHALTLDHLAQILFDFHRGNPRKADDLPHVKHLYSDSKSEKQALRLARVLHFYEQKLPKGELGVLAVLSCFRHPVSWSSLKHLIGRRKGKKKLGEVSRLDPVVLQRCISRLNIRKLVYVNSEGEQNMYTCHPAIREYFYSLIKNAEVIHRSIVLMYRSEAHTPKSINLEAIMSLEDLVRHLVRVGDTCSALDIFRHRLGGHELLGNKLGMFQRGDDILRLFCPAHQEPPGTPMGLSKDEQIYYYQQRSLFAADLGDLVLARSSMGAYLRRKTRKQQLHCFEDGWAKLIQYEILSGRLPSAKQQAMALLRDGNELLSKEEESVRLEFGYAVSFGDFRQEILRVRKEWSDIFIQISSFLTVLNELTFGSKGEWGEVPDIEIGDGWWSAHGSLWHVRCVAALNNKRVYSEIVTNKEKISSQPWNIHKCRWMVELGLAHSFQGEFDAARTVLSSCLDWGNRTANQEAIASSLIGKAQLELSCGQIAAAEEAMRKARFVAVECGYGLHLSQLRLMSLTSNLHELVKAVQWNCRQRHGSGTGLLDLGIELGIIIKTDKLPLTQGVTKRSKKKAKKRLGSENPNPVKIHFYSFDGIKLGYDKKKSNEFLNKNPGVSTRIKSLVLRQLELERLGEEWWLTD